MSKIAEDFFEQITPFFEEQLFLFKKSKCSFVKKKNGLSFTITFKFDGRGGLSMVDWIECSITHDEINGVLRRYFGKYFNYPCLNMRFDISKTSKQNGTNFIPVMYSEQALALANSSNLKALAELPYEEKYPKDLIENCVNWTKNYYKENILNFFESYDSLKKIYNVYSIQNPKDYDLNPLGIGSLNGELHQPRVLFFYLMCSKLKTTKPNFLTSYNKLKLNKSEEIIGKIEKIQNYIF